MKRIAIWLFIMSSLAFSLTIQPVLGETFPAADFNGMQITYSVSGASITSTEDKPGFTTSRTLKGTLGTGNLMVSGSAKAMLPSCGGNFYQYITVSVWVDGNKKTYTDPDPVKCESASESYSFSLSVPIPAGAKGGGFIISETYVNRRYGDRELRVTGEFSGTPVSPTPVGRIDSGARFSGISGQVEIRPDNDPNGWRLAKTETIIYIDDHIKTDEDSTAIIGFADMSVFVMKRDTEIVVSTPPRQDSKLKILFGTIWVNFKKTLKGESFEGEMNQAAATIKGTIFALEETGSTSTLKVADGSVEITHKVTGETLTIYAGEKVTAGKRGFGSKQRFDAESEMAELEKEIPGSSRLMERITSTTGITPGVTAKRTTPKPGVTTPQGDFTVSISPTEMTVDPGENIRFTLTVEPEGDFNEPVEVYVKTEVLGIEKDYGRVKIINPPYKPYVFEKQVPDSIPKGTTITGYVTARGGGLERDAGTVTVNVPGFGTLLAIGALGIAILLRKRR